MGDVVRIKPFVRGQKEWRKGTVSKRLDERSYEVDTDQGTLRRNRRFLNYSREKPHSEDIQDSVELPIERQMSTNKAKSVDPMLWEVPNEVAYDSESVSGPMIETELLDSPVRNSLENSVSATPIQTKSGQTRVGRAVKFPSKYDDFDCKSISVLP